MTSGEVQGNRGRRRGATGSRRCAGQGRTVRSSSATLLIPWSFPVRLDRRREGRPIATRKASVNQQKDGAYKVRLILVCLRTHVALPNEVGLPGGTPHHPFTASRWSSQPFSERRSLFWGLLTGSMRQQLPMKTAGFAGSAALELPDQQPDRSSHGLTLGNGGLQAVNASLALSSLAS